MSKLTCKDFTVKYFGYDAAISDVTTTFLDGINVVYAEGKGGKTTFLKALAGIIPYQGEVLLDGENLESISLKDRDFQMLFDDHALFSRRSARYNLEYPLRIRKIPKEKRRQMVESAAELFDLDVMLDAPVYRLNEWLKVTLSLCRAYLRHSKVLLIDNIFSKLDPTQRKDAFLRFLPLFRDGIVIYATDNAWEAAALTEEIKVLSCGYLIQEGSLLELRTKPNAASVFLAFQDFPSILPCKTTQSGVDVFGASFKIALRLKSDVYLEKNVLAGVGLGDISLSEQGFEAIVVGKFYHNGGAVYSAKVEDRSLFFSSDRDITVGSTVKLAISRVVALFDVLNERNILEVTQ